ncbi:phage holin family protein [Serratia fonticola]
MQAAWWRGDEPIGGVVMAVVMAVLRMAYAGSGWKETWQRKRSTKR